MLRGKNISKTLLKFNSPSAKKLFFANTPLEFCYFERNLYQKMGPNFPFSVISRIKMLAGDLLTGELDRPGKYHAGNVMFFAVVPVQTDFAGCLLTCEREF